MEINMQFETQDSTVKDNKYSVIEFSIPLNTQAFEISSKFIEKDSDSYVLDPEGNSNIFWMRLALLLIVVDLFMFVYNFEIIFSIKVKSEYEHKLSKILKNYGDIVIEVDGPIDMTDLEVIDVKSLKEILDLEDELRIPILFFENVKGQEGWFTLLHNDRIYRHVLRSSRAGKLKTNKNRSV